MPDREDGLQVFETSQHSAALARNGEGLIPRLGAKFLSAQILRARTPGVTGRKSRDGSHASARGRRTLYFALCERVFPPRGSLK